MVWVGVVCSLHTIDCVIRLPASVPSAHWYETFLDIDLTNRQCSLSSNRLGFTSSFFNSGHTLCTNCYSFDAESTCVHPTSYPGPADSRAVAVPVSRLTTMTVQKRFCFDLDICRLISVSELYNSSIGCRGQYNTIHAPTNQS